MFRLLTPFSVTGGLSASQQLLLRGIGLFAGVLLLGAALGGLTRRTGTDVITQYRELERRQAELRGQVETLSLELERAQALLDFSKRYQIPADLTELVHETALREGIEPEVAFRLVQVESGFNARAVSSAGALGLTQVMQATARFYEPAITVSDLMEPPINLRIGFRYLQHLLERYDGNAEMALLAYNRGPSRLAELLGRGDDPRNGYASTIMSGY